MKSKRSKSSSNLRVISSYSAEFKGTTEGRLILRNDLVFLSLFIGHTSSSPTAYSPSHTETNSSGVPLFRTSVRTWVLLESFVTLRPQGHVRDAERRHDSHRQEPPAEPSSTKMSHIVWRTAVNSGLCVCVCVCVCVWIFMLINIVCVLEGLPSSSLLYHD